MYFIFLRFEVPKAVEIGPLWCSYLKKQVRQQDAYPTNAGVQLKLCATPYTRPGQQGQHFRCLCLAYRAYTVDY